MHTTSDCPQVPQVPLGLPHVSGHSQYPALPPTHTFTSAAVTATSDLRLLPHRDPTPGHPPPHHLRPPAQLQSRHRQVAASTPRAGRAARHTPQFGNARSPVLEEFRVKGEMLVALYLRSLGLRDTRHTNCWACAPGIQCNAVGYIGYNCNVGATGACAPGIQFGNARSPALEEFRVKG